MYIIYRIIMLLIQIEQAAILVEAILSWIQIDQLRGVYEFCQRITAPLMNPIRRVMPIIAGLDFSPVVALVLLGFVSKAVSYIFIGMMY
ncbi:YggT family protein [Lacticaseibacillus hulanensis]|uniref:YggT family protein n=1 Tax=Lacticaseibacillus hulanensis TaxID=2493111 RepID=UPI000FDB47CA|nr:YggT family protein [Lacticaseibacillus hulanensis]